jgi:hypothetical protein
VKSNFAELQGFKKKRCLAILTSNNSLSGFELKALSNEKSETDV